MKAFYKVLNKKIMQNTNIVIVSIFLAISEPFPGLVLKFPHIYQLTQLPRVSTILIPKK